MVCPESLGKRVFMHLTREIHWIAQEKKRHLMNIKCLNLALLQCYERGQRIIPQPALCCAFSMIIRPLKLDHRKQEKALQGALKWISNPKINHTTSFTLCDEAVLWVFFGFECLLLVLGRTSVVASAGRWWSVLRCEGSVDAVCRYVTPLQQQVHCLSHAGSKTKC